MPLLGQARQVIVATVAEGDETSEGIATLIEQLRWHGIAADGELIVAAEGSPVAALRAMANSHGPAVPPARSRNRPRASHAWAKVSAVRSYAASDWRVRRRW